jgi:hypothetical protein
VATETGETLFQRADQGGILAERLPVVLVVAVVVVATLVLAGSAMAFNGFRDTYVLTGYCSTCHYTGGVAPAVFEEWALSAHHNTQMSPISRDSGCAGCHTSNYSPQKHIPTAVGTSTFPTAAAGTQGSGTSGFSENYVGCSACHFGASSGPNATVNDTFGTDAADTAHKAPLANLANADICGQCHARYSRTVATYPSWSWPTGQPAPVAGTTQPQYSLSDFNPLGVAPAWTPDPITNFLTIATAANPVGNAFWLGGQSTKAHGEGAAQYEEWMVEDHAKALENLKAAVGPNPQARCLKCHSTDYALAVAGNRTPPTGAEAKYGVTCVGCHKPHAEGSQTSRWNEEKNPQLRTTREELCIQCHNAAIAAGESAKPGQEIHHPVKEIMGGYGAIDVDGQPSVHMGRCVECHMIPTGYEHTGAAATAGNHVFAPVTPKEASSQTTVAAGVTKTMPYSSCSTCHGSTSDPLATYLGGAIVDRQSWTSDSITRVWGLLDAGAAKLGFASAAKARNAIISVPRARRTINQVNLLKGYTNIELVASEGSLGIHNWSYTVAIVNKATKQARAIKSDRWVVKQRASRRSVAWGASVRFSGSVTTSSLIAGRGRVTIQMKSGGAWKNVRIARLNTRGRFSRALRMTSAGVFLFRAKMPHSATNLTGYSHPIRVVVR